MNLQGQNIFFDEKETKKQETTGVSKVKQNIENAKKIDREVPYSSTMSREAYFVIISINIAMQRSKLNFINLEFQFLNILSQVLS